MSEFKRPTQTDVCPCGTGKEYQNCGPHTEEELEYSWLVGEYYPDKINEEVRARMLELESSLGIESLAR